MKDKVFEIPVEFKFSGVFKIKARDAAQAREFAARHCAMTQGRGIHSSLPEEQVDWDFPWHPEKTVGTSDEPE